MSSSRGFTLIELSIVIVIIGLIVAGVVGGQQLVTQAKLRAVFSEANGWKVAVSTFKAQYDAWPGDMNNAHSYWGSSCGTSSQCNGNGDGAIEHNNGTAQEVESLNAWEHLQLSGLIPGGYDGNSTGAHSAGYAPQSVYGPGAYGLEYVTNADLINPVNRNRIIFGTGVVTACSSCWPAYGNILSGRQAYNLDNKFDDGKPNTGNIRGGRGLDSTNSFLGGCTDASGTNNSNSSKTSSYNLSETDIRCIMAFSIY